MQFHCLYSDAVFEPTTILKTNMQHSWCCQIRLFVNRYDERVSFFIRFFLFMHILHSVFHPPVLFFLPFFPMNTFTLHFLLLLLDVLYFRSSPSLSFLSPICFALILLHSFLLPLFVLTFPAFFSFFISLPCMPSPPIVLIFSLPAISFFSP